MKIKCRAKISSNCYDGIDCTDIYEDDTMADDGLFDGETVICDACYITGGQPALPYGRGYTREQIIAHVNKEMGIG